MSFCFGEGSFAVTLETQETKVFPSTFSLLGREERGILMKLSTEECISFAYLETSFYSNFSLDVTTFLGGGVFSKLGISGPALQNIPRVSL